MAVEEPEEYEPIKIGRHKFKVIGTLGSGGQGVVFLGLAVRTKKKVALKLTWIKEDIEESQKKNTC